MKIKHIQSGNIKLAGSQLMVLGAPYGGPLGGKDRQGEYFTDETDFLIEEGDRRPVVLNHGMGKKGKDLVPKDYDVVGVAEVSHRDDKGLWFEIRLKEKFEKLLDKVKKGLMRASSGSLNYLVRSDKDTGRIDKWPIGELTLVDTSAGFVPANDYATVNLKTAFDDVELEYPEAFVKGDEPEADAAKEESGLSAEQLAAVVIATRK